MSSPYGPSGGQDPQQQWGQQPYGGGPNPGTPSGGFPAQGGYGQPPQQPQQQPQYGQQDPSQGQQPQQGQYGGYGQPQQPQPTQQYGQPDPSQGQFGQQVQPGQPGQFGGYGQQQQFGGYPGQPGAGYPGALPEKRKSSTWVWILVVLGVLIVGAVAVLGFIKPGYFLGSKVFDQSAVQQGVKTILTDKYNLDDVGDVSCPAEQPVKKDHRYQCTVTVKGEKRTVDITVRNENGDYEVSTPSEK